jgi:hypothetical protein
VHNTGPVLSRSASICNWGRTHTRVLASEIVKISDELGTIDGVGDAAVAEEGPKALRAPFRSLRGIREGPAVVLVLVMIRPRALPGWVHYGEANGVLQALQRGGSGGVTTTLRSTWSMSVLGMALTM